MSMVFNIARKKKTESEDLSKVFYFTSKAPFSVGLYDTSTKTWDNKLEYSLDNENWVTFEPSTVASCTEADGGKIFFRGAINSTLSGDHTDDTNDNYAFFQLTGNEIACYGNLTALLNYQLLEDNGSAMALTPSMQDYCLYHLFTNCTALVEASFTIPSFIKGTQCCASMFYGCSNLRKVPTIKMTRASNGCFMNMFQGCTSLRAAPTLSIVSLDEMCYVQMFKDCTSLVSPPALPITTLASACYAGMFNGCTALVSAPVLPADELAENCYVQMFYNCTSLVNPPALPATVAAKHCYGSMFYGCTSLVNAPEINLVEIAADCCYQMFENCQKLQLPPALPATTLATRCYFKMFYNCISLTAIPALPATYLPQRCYNQMFALSSNNSNATMLISANTTDDQSVEWRLPYNSSDTATAIDSTTTSQMFYYRGSITVPELNTTYYASAVVLPDGSLVTS